MIITDGLIAAAARMPERPALRCGEMVLSYGDLAARVEATAAAMAGLSRVAVSLRNAPDALIAFLGAVRAGAVAMVFDPAWPAELRARLVAVHRPDRIVDSPPPPNAGKPSRPGPDVPFLMGFTSGTTGTPKAFVRTHASWVASFAAARAAFGPVASGTVLAPGPLCHSLTLYTAVETLEAGGTIEIAPAFVAGDCVDRLRSGEVNGFVGVPSMLDMLATAAERPLAARFTIISAGAKLTPSLRSALGRSFPAATLYEYYGASEISFVTVARPEDDPPAGSVGRAFPGVEVIVRRDDGSAATTGEVGIVWVKTAMASEGYVGPTDGSGFRRDGPWVTVGDRGALDARGFLSLAGRENEMLISGGYNIYPQEIEAVIAALPGVAAAAVLGTPDPRWGQVVTAVISGPARRAELMAACLAALPRYKVPRRWLHIDEMPFTTSGKVARARLAERLLSLPELP